MGGNETVRGRQVEEKVRGIFTVRYRTGYTQDMRVVYQGETYGIVRVDDVEGLRKYIELTAVI
jgi:SPP1 family predicted phage head-tail adaptor